MGDEEMKYGTGEPERSGAATAMFRQQCDQMARQKKGR